MSTPALIWLFLAFLSLLAAAHLHGKSMTGKYSLWMRVVGFSISAGLLYWGGFFASVPA